MEVDHPLVSVVVVAHDRKEFIKEALDSLGNQTLKRKLYEVVVVKNYEDKEIDDYAAGLGFRTILTNEITVGHKMSIGVENSSAEIVTFLEDDDLFEKNKLKAIVDAFDRNQPAGMLHNSYSVIGKNANFLYADNRGFNSLEIGPEDDFIRECIRNSVKVSDFAYSSCISVRREIISRDLEGLKKIQSAPDYFVVFSCLNSKHNILLISDKLTKYRLHDSQSIRFGTFNEFIAGNRDIRARWISDYESMNNHFSDTKVKAITKFFSDYNRLIYLGLGSERNVSVKVSAIVKMMHSPDFIRFYQGWWVLLLAALSSFVPFAAQRFYHIYRRNKYYGGDEQVQT